MVCVCVFSLCVLAQSSNPTLIWRENKKEDLTWSLVLLVAQLHKG